MDKASQPELSIIVCTYNRRALLERCLTSLTTQNNIAKSQFEIIVVNNNSRDDTAATVERLALDNLNLRQILETQQGLSYARNRGAFEARGRYLIYLDDDATVAENYLKNILHILKTFKPIILGGPVYPYYLTTKPAWFKDSYEIRKWAEQSGFSTTCRISGGNFIIEKQALLDLGGFDVQLGMKGSQIGLGEEALVLDTYRARTPETEQRVYYALECSIQHYVSPEKMTLRYFLTRSYAYGQSYMQSALIRQPVKGQRRLVRLMLNLIYSTFISTIRAFIHTLRQHGLGATDYLGLFRGGCAVVGIVITGAKLIFGKI